MSDIVGIELRPVVEFHALPQIEFESSVVDPSPGCRQLARVLPSFWIAENQSVPNRVGATSHPTAEWISCQLREAFPWNEAPNYLIRDNDAEFGDVFQQSIYRMGIRDRPIAPRSPWRNGCVERVIGSIRRELFDHVIVWSEPHLRRLLAAYQNYYNTVRTHIGIAKDAPDHRPVQALGAMTAGPLLGGLHHRYGRI